MQKKWDSQNSSHNGTKYHKNPNQRSWKTETHAKGEGSTKRAIRRGLEWLFSASKRGGPSSSSSGLISEMVILLALTSSFVLCTTPFRLTRSEWQNRRPLVKTQLGTAPDDWEESRGRTQTVDENEEQEEEEEVAVVGIKGGEREGFIERQAELMMMIFRA